MNRSVAGKDHAVARFSQLQPNTRWLHIDVQETKTLGLAIK